MFKHVQRNNAANPMTWEQFKSIFFEKYILKNVRDQKAEELLKLVKNNKTVAKYEAKFISLSRYAPHLVDNENHEERSWKATLHIIAALSTTEAEYIAAIGAVNEAIWLKGLVDLGLKRESSTVYCNSQSAIHLTINQMFHERTKHIDV
ncbi:hypothetical protein RJ639_028375 [Escallonia herrerae]|uniref:Retrotransposon gag domain-containing protein n=1 Tax=Escallonia herrerae TaxID=1293975 RepID=A0AA89BEH4_9ASTE|nr:hypothetical protein RJ639_028375 [Escallonia herrerae]